MWSTIVTVLETVKRFWKLVSKNRFPKLNDFAVNMRWTFGNTYNTCARPRAFSALKQVKSTIKSEIECRSVTRGAQGRAKAPLENFSSPLKYVLDTV